MENNTILDIIRIAQSIGLKIGQNIEPTTDEEKSFNILLDELYVLSLIEPNRLRTKLYKSIYFEPVEGTPLQTQLKNHVQYLVENNMPDSITLLEAMFQFFSIKFFLNYETSCENSK